MNPMDIPVFCPCCGQRVREYYVPRGLRLTDDPLQTVCRCPYCHGWIDQQVQRVLDLVMDEQEIREWVWKERVRLMKLVETADELLDFWGMLSERAHGPNRSGPEVTPE